MKYHNLKVASEVVSYQTAVRQGLGSNQGLFFPKSFEARSDIDELLELPTQQRNIEILKPFIGEDLPPEQIADVIQQAFSFPAVLNSVESNSYCLELFHGPTLAFKDFGAKFMAACLKQFSNDKKITILTATSGDTGAAVAHAFFEVPNIEVVILYPKGKISELQEKMFTTLGKNIRTVAIEGTFDDCQHLVKRSFDDPELVKTIGLNSANSINISRLLAQVCYYFEAFAQLPKDQRKQVVVSVPSGNFGNLTAGIIAKTLGLPIKRFIATTNINDTVPRYLETGEWTPNKTQPTLSNAMDVSSPNNWPRIEYLIESGQFDRELLIGCSINEEQTKNSVEALFKSDYLSEPHAAVAYAGLSSSLTADEVGIFLGTAHPAKFKQSVEDILDIELPLPEALAQCVDKQDLSIEMAADFGALKTFLSKGQN
jgi:threonine synthase